MSLPGMPTGMSWPIWSSLTELRSPTQDPHPRREADRPNRSDNEVANPIGGIGNRSRLGYGRRQPHAGDGEVDEVAAALEPAPIQLIPARRAAPWAVTAVSLGPRCEPSCLWPDI